jgi:tRNA pseudouridine38-40 synthase
VNVGLGKTSLQEFKEIIEGRDRTKAGASVPAKALFLTQVKYPESVLSHE